MMVARWNIADTTIRFSVNISPIATSISFATLAGTRSARARRTGEGAQGARPGDPARSKRREYVSEFATRAKAAWARLIRKVYEADALECPKCEGPMRVIALIDDPGVVRRILPRCGCVTPGRNLVV